MSASHDSTIPSADADLTAAVLTLFHGTRRSLADRIIEQGFAPLPVETQIAAVAERYTLSADTLREHLEAHHRFTHLDDRPGTVSMVAKSDGPAAGRTGRPRRPGMRLGRPTIY